MSDTGSQRLDRINQMLAKQDSLSSGTYKLMLTALESQDESYGYNEHGQLKVAMFDSRSYDIAAFNQESHQHVELVYIESSLNQVSAIQAEGCLAICIFVNDDCSAGVISRLAKMGVKLIALRCAGFNNVDLEACKRHNIDVVSVPEYSPNAVAEHTIGLIMMLNRKLHQAYMRNKNGQYVLDGLIGFDMIGKTVGVVGVGRIGVCLINILVGFGCNVLAHDIAPNKKVGEHPLVDFVDMDQLIKESDIISLHAPLSKDTFHMIDEAALSKMKNNVMLINTSRGALIDTKALVRGLKSGKIGSAGLDVYEEEAGIFFHDKSSEVITDDVFARLTTFNNVVITSHQGFLTKEALSNIAQTTLGSFTQFNEGKRGEELTYLISH